VHPRACVRPPSSPAAAVAARERRRRARVLCSGRRCRWRPRCITGGRTCVSARSFAAAVVVGGRVGSVCACALLLAAVFLCARRWSRPFLDEGAAEGGLPHLFGGRSEQKRPPFAPCPRGVGLCEDRPLRQHGSSRAASDLKNGAPARSAAVLPYVPTHAGRR